MGLEVNIILSLLYFNPFLVNIDLAELSTSSNLSPVSSPLSSSESIKNKNLVSLYFLFFQIDIIKSFHI